MSTSNSKFRTGSKEAPTEPFKVADNLYSVGTEGLSAWLLTSAKGHVLIDGAMPTSGGGSRAWTATSSPATPAATASTTSPSFPGAREITNRPPQR